MSIDFIKNLKTDSLKNFFSSESLFKKISLISLIVFLVLIVLFFSVSSVYGMMYKDKIYHGVYLNGYSLGGLNSEELENFLENLENRVRDEGINYSFEDNGQEKNIKIDITTVSTDNSFDLASWDKSKLVSLVVSLGKDGNFWQKIWQPYALILKKQSVVCPVVMINEEFSQILKDKLTPFEGNPRDAGISISGINPINFEVISEKTGEIFDYDEILEQTKNALAVFSWEKIIIKKRDRKPQVVTEDIGSWVEKNLSDIYNLGDVTFVFLNDATKQNDEWKIKKDDLINWVQPHKDESGQMFLNISNDKFTEYFSKNVIPLVNRPAENPKFSMSQGKVEEMRAGSDGREVDLAATYELLTSEFEKIKNGQEATTTLSILVIDTPPEQKLSDLNDYGITGVIGIGISHFKNSHSNRIKNIANAVKILNGTVIAPGEEFSTNNSAGPFTLENGYLAEDVIKGDQIVKEIAGGMCQIGTTLFRMAMNSGMPITERRNHSLVVSYYADPVNGNPGTDATVYEPILDFKFLNDTGSYLLIQTEMDTVNEELVFTLWGKPDGRSGSYTHPIVSRWIPAGEAQTIESASMAPGQKKCQNAFPGAVASFTYTRTTPEGETIDRVFDSYYRALPAICWVGSEEEKEDSSEESSSGETTDESVCTGDNCAENSLPENLNDSIIEDDADSVVESDV